MIDKVVELALRHDRTTDSWAKIILVDAIDQLMKRDPKTHYLDPKTLGAVMLSLSEVVWRRSSLALYECCQLDRKTLYQMLFSGTQEPPKQRKRRKQAKRVGIPTNKARSTLEDAINMSSQFTNSQGKHRSQDVQMLQDREYVPFTLGIAKPDANNPIQQIRSSQNGFFLFPNQDLYQDLGLLSWNNHKGVDDSDTLLDIQTRQFRSSPEDEIILARRREFSQFLNRRSQVRQGRRPRQKKTKARGSYESSRVRRATKKQNPFDSTSIVDEHIYLINQKHSQSTEQDEFNKILESVDITKEVNLAVLLDPRYNPGIEQIRQLQHSLYSVPRLDFNYEQEEMADYGYPIFSQFLHPSDKPDGFDSTTMMNSASKLESKLWDSLKDAIPSNPKGSTPKRYVNLSIYCNKSSLNSEEKAQLFNYLILSPEYKLHQQNPAAFSDILIERRL